MTNQFKPKLRREADIDLKAAINGAIWSLFLRTDIFPFQSCLSCIHFQEAKEHCRLWNAKPPARVIAYACDKYSDANEIPF